MEAQLKKYRISSAELDLIRAQLGRDPEGVEWALYSALWSEHCSYKSSRRHLKKFAGTLKAGSQGGENAGLIDLGKDEKVIFKMESHNHPSFIEPFHGAATGVGGILRDIFTMGARPIALADFLCFGDQPTDKMKSLYKGVVKGISHYGNCVGVPTTQGITNFHPAYQKNILVNAMAVGLLEKGQPMISSKPLKKKSLIVYVGSKTGRDGVHGAAMASESFGQDLTSKKPNIQIGDPYFEKLLIEACLSVAKENLIECMQDMGAAGLTSSSFEMAAQGQIGFDINLDLVPQREADMEPEEILLSESQERMLLLCDETNLTGVQKHFAKYGLEAVKIGDTDPSRTDVKLMWHGKILTRMEPKHLVDNAPMYDRPYERKANAVQSEKKPAPWPHPALREWIYRQYDQRVGTRTVRTASQSSAFMILPSGRTLGVALGCDPWLTNEDARTGAFDAFMRPFLNLTIKGATPKGLTDCMNFGNPEKPFVMAQFVDSVETFTELGKLLSVPVVSGNVSFYNETEGENIPPTPAVGIIGLAETTSLPFDELKSASKQVYLVKMPLEKLIEQKENLPEITDSLRNWVTENKPASAKLLSRRTWRESLISLCSERSLILEKSWEKQLDFPTDLYSIVFSVKDEASANSLKAWGQKTGFAVELLGTAAPGSQLRVQTQDILAFKDWRSAGRKSLEAWGL
ncbi:MAG: phosphoribosylformylglycinamidine synthase subunit PurL [Bdellovibrionota bacterium]